VFRCDLTNACAFCFLPSHTRLWAHWVPGIPHTLRGGEFLHSPGAMRRGKVETCSFWSSLRGAKQSTLAFLLPHGLLRGACHRAALYADPLARNDGSRLF
jgi:hypothetical protein